jgi:RNA polymerase sigma-70 factor (ECF subfamily)
MNEQKAIRLCIKNRDPIGFEYLVQKYRKRAFYYAVSWLNNTEDALDACQESFSRAFGAITRIKKLEKFYPWFYVILRNCCMNILADRKKSYKINDELFRDVQRGDSGKDRDTLSSMVNLEDNRKIHDLLDLLKPEFREILILKYFNDMNYEEIGALLSIPRGTVMSRLYNAREAFHKTYTASKKEE